MSQPHCPHHASCNFLRTAREDSHPDLRPRIERFCADPLGWKACFRAHFAANLGANLSGDITPDACCLEGLSRVLPASDMAADAVARVFARRPA